MIKEYLEGTSFIKENGTYLEENKHMSALFFIDAPLLKEVNSKNYALRAYKGDKKLLGLKLEPYNLRYIIKKPVVINNWLTLLTS